MDQGDRSIRERNPREKASLFSLLSFFYTLKLFRKGLKKDITEDDVYEVVPEFASEKVGDKLEYYWYEERKKNKYPSVYRLLIICYAKFYLFLGIVQLCVKTGLILLQPTTLSKLVAYFKPGQTAISKSDAYNYAFLLIVLNIIDCVYTHNYQQFLTEFVIKVRTSLCSLIYRKALKLSPMAFSDVTMGNIVTLITKDVYSIDGALSYLNDIWIGLIQTILISYMLYSRIGYSAILGIGFFLLIIPIQIFVGKKVSKRRLLTAKRTDERLQHAQEALSAVKIIKMYTWEKYFTRKISEARMDETSKMIAVYYLKAFILIVGGLTHKISLYLLIMAYVWTGNYLQAETAYFMQQCLQNLTSTVIISIPVGIGYSADMIAAVKRIQKFFNADEVDDQPAESRSLKPRVCLRNVAMDIKGKPILTDVSFELETGLLLLTGNLGSGKSSILKTILNDYQLKSGKLLVEGSISYAPEEPWLFPSTIRQNIIFGQPYNEKRYQDVLHVCALTYDLNNFEKGDNTIIGDKGVNLSKGQQGRITLARAVYKNSDIYLLDDCLSALDSYVNKYIFKECIRGFLKDKLVILVTNNINHIKMAPSNVLLVENGRTLNLQQQKESLDKRITYYIDEDDTNNIESEDDDEDFKTEHDLLLDEKVNQEPQKNLYYEECKTGKVKLNVFLRYYKSSGGIILLLLLFLVFVLCEVAMSYSYQIVRLWVKIEPKLSDYNIKNLTNTAEFEIVRNERNKLLNTYTIMVIAGSVLAFCRSYTNFFLCAKAGRKLHGDLTHSVFNTFMTFFDTHFFGNIINRFSKDFYTIDESIPFVIYENFRAHIGVVGAIILISSVNLYLLIPAGMLFVKLYFIRRYYTPTGRNIRRLEAATRSPMIGYLNASLEGLTTIRAYEQQNILKYEFDRHQDLFTSAFYMNKSTGIAFAFFLDITCSLCFASIVLKFLIFDGGEKGGDVGLAITQSIILMERLQGAIRQTTELETAMTAVERVIEYTDVETENKTAGQIKENWPDQGRIAYDNVRLTYKSTGDNVLKSLSFYVDGNEKIGIVGRTGAGKSSIISTLFRLYDIEGRILIDNEDIKTISLEYLRSNMAIIPQDPVLFTGTIRSNIDPLQKYDDATIWNAIEKINLKHIVGDLYSKITEKGFNLSAGQRQLLCLARALISKSKIIVLDEATANMDPETDGLLQKCIQDHFSNCTVLTIAHRLKSVLNSDRVMVVDSGKIIEFDSPSKLLENKEGLFYKMIHHSGI